VHRQPRTSPSGCTVSFRCNTCGACCDLHHWRTRQSLYYKRNWGVEIIGVKPALVGWILAFKYRVLDPEKAKRLNDRQTRGFPAAPDSQS